MVETNEVFSFDSLIQESVGKYTNEFRMLRNKMK